MDKFEAFGKLLDTLSGGGVDPRSDVQKMAAQGPVPAGGMVRSRGPQQTAGYQGYGSGRVLKERYPSTQPNYNPMPRSPQQNHMPINTPQPRRPLGQEVPMDLLRRLQAEQYLRQLQSSFGPSYNRMIAPQRPPLPNLRGRPSY